MKELKQIIGSAAVVLGMALILALGVILAGAGYRQWTVKQTALHEAANTLRSVGYEEASAEIKALQKAWAAEEPYMTWIEVPVEIPEDEVPTAEAQETLTSADTETPPEDLPVWEQFNQAHPGKTCTEAGFWTMCKMDSRETGTAPMGIKILVCKTAVNRCLYGTEFPDDLYEVIGQRGQYSTSYLTDHDEGFSEATKQAVTYALLMGDTIEADLSPTGSVFTVPHSAFYHGNYLTGGTEWYRISSQTSGGYRFTLVFGQDPRHCNDEG